MPVVIQVCVIFHINNIVEKRKEGYQLFGRETHPLLKKPVKLIF